MDTTVTTTPQSITVRFGRNLAPQFAFTPAANNIVVSGRGSGTVSFNLSVNQGSLTVFAMPPIKFRNDSRVEIDQPDGTSFALDTEKKILTVTVDTTKAPSKINFSLIVERRDGTRFDSYPNSYPTIVTMLPPDGNNMNMS